MFLALSTEIASRLAAIRTFLVAHDSLVPAYSVPAATCRGLAFVELYATYEFAVHGSVQATLAGLRFGSAAYSDMRPSLLSLTLLSNWEAAIRAGRPRMWEKRIALLERVCYGGNASDLPDTSFPSDGSHFRAKQLHTVWAVLGITAPVVPDNRLLGRIEELVENRNAISHGRRTASDVGRAYTRGDVVTRVSDTELICRHIVDTLRNHLDSGALLTR